MTFNKTDSIVIYYLHIKEWLIVKLFKIEATQTDFDEYYSIVVIAPNEDRAMDIAKKGNPWNYGLPSNSHTENKVFWEFTNDQEPLIISEINLEQEQVILSSYRGS